MRVLVRRLFDQRRGSVVRGPQYDTIMATKPRITRLLIAVAAMLSLTLRAATPVSAHVALESSEPVSGSALASLPSSLTLEFSEAVVPESVAVSLEDETGAPIALDTPVLTNDDRSLAIGVRQTVGQTGLFQVRWSVRSATDGHNSSGLIAFTVGTGRAPVDLTLSSTERDPWWLVAIRALWMLSMAAIAARIVAGFGFGAPIRSRIVITAGIASVACALVAIRPWDDFDWPSNAARFSLAAGVVGGIAALVAVVGRRLLASTGLFVWLGAIALSAGAGHAAGTDRPVLATAIVTLHTALALLWVAGLIALLTGINRSRRQSSITSFSRWATGGLLALVVAGLGTAALHLPDAQSSWESGYGKTLLVKTALVMLVMAISATNRWITLPTLSRTPPGAPVDRATLGLLAGEVALLAVVVSIAATLSGTSPPSDRAIVQVAAPVRSLSESTVAGDLRIELQGMIAGTLDDTLRVSTNGPGDVERVLVSTRYVDPSTGNEIDGERFDATAVPGAAGEYSFSALRLSRQAIWAVAVTVRRSGVLDETATFTIDTSTWTSEPPRVIERSWHWPLVPAGAWALLALAIAIPAAGLTLIHRHGQLSPLSGAILIAALAMIATGFVVQAWQRSAVRTDGHDLEAPGAANPLAARSNWETLCLACHAADGSGLDQATPGHSHGGGTNLLDARSEALSDGDLYWLISHGVAGSDMPAYDVALTDQQRWDLVAYLRSLQAAEPVDQTDR
jgi:copper transport protein